MKILNATQISQSLTVGNINLGGVAPGQLSKKFDGSKNDIMGLIKLGTPEEIAIIYDSPQEFANAREVCNALVYLYSSEEKARAKLIDKNEVNNLELEKINHTIEELKKEVNELKKKLEEKLTLVESSNKCGFVKTLKKLFKT